nr:sirohydrochlorin cobaltochelatase [uncultured Oscillibacter sp.]
MKKAVICVSFGTTVDAARESITAVENVLREAAGDRLFVRAFTSPTVRRVLAERGETVPDVFGAMEDLKRQGVRRVVAQPTLVVSGREYDEMRENVRMSRGDMEILTGDPLLADTADIKALAVALSEEYPPCREETLVLFGHGTDHFANAVYPALQLAFQLAGREDVLVGTVEGWPAYEDVSRQLAGGGKRVHLVPLMLAAGDHVVRDMAGADADSWASRLTAEGYTVRCTLRGLGMLPAVQAMYRAHLESKLRHGF